MNLFNLFKIAYLALMRNKTRALLTMLGIVIGIASVIAMVSLGQSSSLSINNQISEFRTNALTIGAGYAFREFPVIFKFLSNRTSQTNTTLRLRADFVFRDDLSILRRIAEDDPDLPQISDGKNTVSINCSADYVVSNNVTIRLFFDRVINKPRVSTIATANTSAGFSINLSLAQ